MEYRREIDGLRALAVLPVILFHAGFQFCKGGFLGVDVFFVISGYLITSIILADLRDGKFSIVNFYERRARRILPALFVVSLVSVVFAWLWLPPLEMQDFSESLAAVSVFGSNLWFWQSSGYFDTAAELKPLLHTWSLAVEEQYYVFFPALLLLIWKFDKRWMTPLLVGAFVGSLIASLWTSLMRPEAAFYLLPYRGWELLCGALIAVYGWRERAARWPSWLNELGGASGLTLILFSVAVFSKAVPFPGVLAVAPVTGTTLVLVCAGEATLAGKLLGQRALVGVGLVSYSAYLWHQPLLAFARHRSLGEPDQSLLGFLAVLSLAAAYFSWKFVEAPFRNRERLTRKTAFTLAALGSVLLLAVGVVGHFSRGLPSRNAVFADLANVQTILDSRCHEEGRRSAEQIADGDICTLGSGVEPDVAVIGDSHAGALFEPLSEQAVEKGFSFYAVSGGYCAPLIGFRMTRYQAPDCAETTAAAFEKVIESESIRHVVLAAEWANYTKGYREEGAGAANSPGIASDESGSAEDASQNPQVFERTLAATIQALTRAGKDVVIVGPTPEFHRPVLNAVAKVRLFDAPESSIPVITREKYAARNREVFDAFDRLQGVTVLAVEDLFCSRTLCRSVDDQGRVLFSDGNHVTGFGGSLVAARIVDHLRAR